MRLTLDRDALIQAVAHAVKAVPPRSTQPIYLGLLLTADDGALTFSAFDNSNLISATATITAQVHEAGQRLLPGRLLSGIAKFLTDETVTLTDEDNRVKIVCGKSTFMLPTMPVEDYPALPVQPVRSGAVGADLLAAAIAQVAVAAAGAGELTQLAGIRVEFTGTTITFAATDRYRLAVREVPWRPDAADFTGEIVLPAKALTDAVKGMRGDGAELTVGVTAEGMFGLASQTRTTTLAAIAEDFINWRAILGPGGKLVASANAAELASAIEAVAAARGEDGEPIRITFGAESFLVSTGGEGSSGSREIAGSFNGAETTVGFNPQFLRDGVLQAGTDEVQLAMSTPLKPAILTGKGSEDFRYMVMPVRLPAS